MAVPGPLTWRRCEGTLWCLLPRWVAQCACLCKWLQGSLLSRTLPLPSAGHSYGTIGAVPPCPHPHARGATELVLVVRKGGWHKRG